MTLSQTASLAKKIIALSGIIFFIGTVSFIGYKIWHAYYIANLPPIEEKPDTKFGILPYPDFPTSAVSSSNFSYSIDTSTGNLPKLGIDAGFDKIIKVYFIPKSYSSLLSPQKSQELANKFNMLSNPQILSETKYRFSEGSKTLTVDLDTNNFLYTKEASVSSKVSLDEDERLVLGFETILSNLGVMTDDLKKGRTKVTLLKSDGKNLIPTTLRTEAQAAQISLWIQNIDKKSIFTPDFNKGLVYSIVSPISSDLENYSVLQFNLYPIDTSTYATYSIKTAEIAYNDLKSGKGIVILQPSKPQVSISSVYLGYYLPNNYTPYLQPIYVFEGQNFVAYIPAITDEFITQTK